MRMIDATRQALKAIQQALSSARAFDRQAAWMSARLHGECRESSDGGSKMEGYGKCNHLGCNTPALCGQCAKHRAECLCEGCQRRRLYLDAWVKVANTQGQTTEGLPRGRRLGGKVCLIAL